MNVSWRQKVWYVEICCVILSKLLPSLVFAPTCSARADPDRPLPCGSLSSDILWSGLRTTGICQGQS